MSSILKLENAIFEHEMLIANASKNLADWFANDRIVPEKHTGKTLFESKYVSSMVATIEENYKQISVLMALIAEFDEELF